MAGPTPSVAQRAVCDRGMRCHVHGKGLKRFGTKFSQARVADLASSSVQLISTDETGANVKLASGTLIHPNVVLCAAHSIASAGSKIEILMYFECNAKTAPPGAARQYGSNFGKWTTCTREATKPQAEEVKTLEKGNSGGLDYALLSIRWKKMQKVDSTNVVELPRIPTLPRPSATLSEELLVAGHYWTPGKAKSGEPTQASAGELLRADGPNPQSSKGQDYAYADFAAREGLSGGGVFNESGRIVGVLKGAGKVKFNHRGREVELKKPCFLNLSRVPVHDGDTPSRISTWLSTGIVLRRGDRDDNVVFKPA